MAGGQLPHLATMKSALLCQLSAEVVYKEGELQTIEDRIGLAKMLLYRLRLGILAQHYGVSAFTPELDYSEEAIGVQSSWDEFEEEFLAGQINGEQDNIPSQTCSGASSVVDDSAVSSQTCSRDSSPCDESGQECDGEVPTGGCDRVQVKEEPMDNYLDGDCRLSSQDTHDSGIHENSRFYVKKRIIVGNTSQYIDPTLHCDGSSHKWMVYVRGSSEESDISHFVKTVRFFLHPSYHPNDIVLVSKPPFHLMRLGWGEFPVRVQLEFIDHRNKPVDIIHNLVLDRTHTGQQTLGAETIVDVDIVGFQVDGLVNGDDCQCTAAAAAHDVKRLPEVEDDLQSVLKKDMCLQEAVVKEEEPVNSPGPPLEDNEGVKQPLIIRHITLPTSTLSDIILLDHDYCTNVVVTQLIADSPTESDCSGTEAILVKEGPKPLVVTTNLDKCLRSAVQATPLWGPPSEDFHLTATSLAQFKGWNAGRRRAAEWMRAVAVKRSIQKKLKLALLSTREVMEWCRRNGFTPLDPAVSEGSGFCKFCGCQLESVEDEDSEPELDCHEECREMFDCGDGGMTTLSTPFELFGDVVSLHGEMEMGEAAQREGQDIDVTTVSVPQERRYPLEVIPRYRVPQTLELKWVQQTSAKIGIRIYPCVIDHMYAHVVEHMIYMACSRFMRALLTQAMQEAGKTMEGESSRERVLVPMHLYLAIQNLEFSDFLTNRYFGLHVITREE